MSQKSHTAAFLQRNVTPGDPVVAGSVPSVVVLTGSRVGTVFPLKPKGSVLGRAEDTDIVIDDDGISRVHAMIMIEDGRWVVRDLGSTNGTFVGERRVGETPLMIHPGDRIRCGSDILLRFGDQAELHRDWVAPLYQALTRDPLTGLRNRMMLEDLLAIEVAWHQRHDLPLSVMVLDIDLLTAVNDTFGFRWGDQVLKTVGDVLLEQTRTEDVVARYGGEEFVVVLRHTDLESAHDLADNFREHIGRRQMVLDGRKARVTVSVGVATHEADELVSGEALLGEANSNLFLAKQQGRNRVVSGLEE